MSLRVLAAAAALLVAVPLVATPGVADDRIQVEPAGPDAPSWSEVLADAVERTATTPYRARMLIVNLDQGGPHLAEVDLARGQDRRLRLGRAESWLVGRDADQSFFVDASTGHLIELGRVDHLELGLGEVDRKYDVELSGQVELDAGRCWVLSFAVAPDELRERLFVHQASGLIVRRETYSDGRPVRVVTLTDVRVDDAEMDEPSAPSRSQLGARNILSPEGIETLTVAGWDIPRELPGGFELAASYAVPAADRGAVHLVYSDGLYVLSIYEQVGNMAPGAAAGAVPFVRDGMHVYRWPGSEPERMVWTGAGRTFTAVTDASVDMALNALAALPSDPPDRFRDRVGRGFARIGTWIWPFD